MSVSKVSICNYALSSLGSKLITLLDNSTHEGRQCLARYEPTRDALLEMFNWTFAKAQVELARSATNPVYGFGYKYLLPSDCIKVRSMEETAEYEVVGKHIHTSSETATISYTKREEDETFYSSLFCILFSMRMAKDLCMPLTGSKSLLQRVEGEYLTAFAEAVDINASLGTLVDESVAYDSGRS